MLLGHYSCKVALSYVAVAVGKLLVACFHLGNLRCEYASLQVVVVVKVEDGANLTIQSCFIYQLTLICYLQVMIL